jgi:4-diphosphocytidyl-2-C-methyl-D-erythritol kinase
VKRIVLKSPAKINLALDVVGKRADGYHLLETVFQAVSIYDTITVTFQPDAEHPIQIACNIPWIPKDERNIAWKAAALFQKVTGVKTGIRIYLQKYIPSQAGLGGGSSDAAAVLYACNQLAGTGLTQQQLCDMGMQLGADVPFFFYGGTAYAAGIGEQLRPLPYLGDFPVVIAKGKGGISTAMAYNAIDALQHPIHPDTQRMVELLQQSADITEIAPLCGNLFSAVTDLPPVTQIQKKMMEKGALCSAMTGSGSAVFGIFRSQEQAQRCCTVLRRITPFSVRCKTIPHTFHAV